MEKDPVKLLDVTMKITQVLAQKQKRLDAEFEEAERRTPGSVTYFSTKME